MYKGFSGWLDRHLSKGLPDGIIAVNFNLYEGSGQTYDVELVGCDSFDEDDEDWVCDEVFTTRDDLFCLERTDDISGWEQGLACVTDFVEKYLSEGGFASILKKYEAVGIGFVDGDIEIVYRS